MEKEQIFNIIDACNMHRQKVLGVCMRYFGFSIDDAEDCVQEAYFALYNDLLQGRKFKIQRLGSIKSLSTKAKSWSVHNNKKENIPSLLRKKWNRSLATFPAIRIC